MKKIKNEHNYIDSLHTLSIVVLLIACVLYLMFDLDSTLDIRRFEASRYFVFSVLLLYSIMLIRDRWFTSASELLDKLKIDRAKVEESNKTTSVLGMMIFRREVESHASAKIFVSSFVWYLVFCFLLGLQISPVVGAILFIGAAVPILQDKLVRYRVNNNLFGNNESEAREIIKFIIKNADDSDFTDGGKRKPIFSKDDISDVINQAWNADGARLG